MIDLHPPVLTLRQYERLILVFALEQHGWNVKATAETLGMARATIYRRMTVLSIKNKGRRKQRRAGEKPVRMALADVPSTPSTNPDTIF